MVKAFLVNGFSTCSEPKYDSTAIERENIVAIPDIINFVHYSRDDVEFFKNHIGACIAISPMGQYESSLEAEQAYHSFESDYNNAYDHFKIIAGCSESDWNMVLISDNACKYVTVDHSFVILGNIDKFFDIAGFVDACIIYQSLIIIRSFISSLKNKKRLSKKDSFLIGYYSEMMSSVSTPNSFLIGKDEITEMSLYYSEWKLESIIGILVKSLESSIQINKFINEYEGAKKEKITSRLFEVLTIVLGFTSLYSFFSNPVIKKVLVAIFAFVSLVLFVLIIVDLIIYSKENSEYREWLKKK